MPEIPDTTDRVAAAVAAVPASLYHGADGQAVRPCTPAAVTHRHLSCLDVRPGANILEIGTGSGYSAALIAHLVGHRGRVTTVDIDSALSARAAALYDENGHRVTTVVGDGLLGYLRHAPYDRILVGTTPPVIPNTWMEQLHPSGILLTGVHISDLPGSYAIARITIDEDHQPKTTQIHHGGYTPMAAPAMPTGGTHVTAPDQPHLSLTTRGIHDEASARAFLACLRSAPHVKPAPLCEDDFFHFKNWLTASDPEGLLVATLTRGTGIGLGLIGSGGAAHAAIITGEHHIVDHPESPAGGALLALLDRWKQSGSPRTHDLGAQLVSTAGGWTARLSLT